MAAAKRHSIAVIGASGYTGLEAIRLLDGHPDFDLVAATSRSYAGQPLASHVPGVTSRLEFEDLRPVAAAERADGVLVCLPHKEAAEVVAQLVGTGKAIVDLSADFRFPDPKVYAAWYHEHPYPGLLSQAVYGLTEYNRARIAQAQLVANPGCYVTTVLMALLPIATTQRIVGAVIADCASGVSGAGRAAKENLLFGSVHDDYKPYGVEGHRHQPEIETHLREISGKTIPVDFVPHLLPIDRGILATLHVQIEDPDVDLNDVLNRQYATEPFVRVLGDGLPGTKAVRGTNMVHLRAFRRDLGKTAVPPVAGAGANWLVFGALDNLCKGASGQAIQNLNVMFGLEETAGLPTRAVVP